MSEEDRDKDRGFTDKEQALALEKLEAQYGDGKSAKPTWREKALQASASAAAASANGSTTTPGASAATPAPTGLGFVTSARRASATDGMNDMAGATAISASATPSPLEDRRARRKRFNPFW